MNPTGRAIVANSVLLSTTFFFLSIWGGTNKGVKKVKSIIMNYLAAGTMQKARIRVSWLQCCQSRENGGLDLINPEDAMHSLMLKWLIKALEPGKSNLHLLMQYRLGMCQPYSRGRWCPSLLEFFTMQKNQSKRGSMV